MAATAAAAAVTEAHRLAQAQLGREVAAIVIRSWAVLDPEALDATVERWLNLLLPVIDARRATSAGIAANYLRTFRTLELGSRAARFAPLLAAPLEAAAITTPLTVTGPVALKRGTARGVPLARSVEHAQSSTARTAMRLVTDAGNETIMRTVAADPKALGFARVTSGSPCAFCAMLASRGGTYRTERSARFEAHDGCNCKPEPIYRGDARLPPGSQRFADLWRESSRGAPKGGALNAFRRALNSTTAE